MQLRYELTLSDYLSAQALHAKRSGLSYFSRILGYVICPVLGCLFLAWNLASGLFTSSPAIAVLVPVYLLACPLILRWNLRRCYRRTRSSNCGCTIDFEPNLVRTASASTRSEIEWSAIRRFSEDNRTLLLYLAPAKYIAIPKRVCTAEQVRELRALFETKIRPDPASA